MKAIGIKRIDELNHISPRTCDALMIAGGAAVGIGLALLLWLAIDPNWMVCLLCRLLTLLTRA